MEWQETKNEFWKANRGGMMLPLLFLIPIVMFQDPLFDVFGEQNYVALHLIFEIFIIASSFTIAIQAWMIFPHILSNHRLWLGALFFSVGLLETFHAVTYTGMPFFLMESSPYKATWFYMVSRLMQAGGLLLIVVSAEKQINSQYRWIAYFLAFIHAAVWVTVLFYPAKLLPELVVEGEGTTALKNSLQYAAIALQLFCVLILIKTFKTAKTRNCMMAIASIYLIISDSLFTSYKSVNDLINCIGHLFQLTGFYCLLRALYYTSVEEPFRLLEEARKRLKKSEESLYYIAHHDELTKLPNMRYFTEKLARSLKREPEKSKAVFVLEIDRFHTISESLGHSFGDLVLQSVAARFREDSFKELFVGKMRGEKFAVFLNFMEGEEEAAAICRYIHSRMKEPFQVQHLQLNITLNIGISLYPERGKNENELLRQAQVAMCEARGEVNRYTMYRSSMDQQFLDRLVLEHDLHKAIDKGELYLNYQPQFDLRTGRILSLEALIRWKHPEKGWISPGQFIPIAEETGLIIPIGEWVLKTACRQLKCWHDRGFPPFAIAVNLSARQFFQQNLIDIVKESLKETGLPPRFLELEITESMTMNVSYAAGVLTDLKRIGIRIAVDDFGTGYSSLCYLKDLPIDCLKIDRSFIQQVQTNNHDAALISMIMSITEHLQIEAIAEGIERVEQLRFLWKHHCYHVQGYLFSPPIPPEELEETFYELEERAISYCERLTDECITNK
ncbi:EAL domain-containing protein [Bacillus sp. B190/17]|uniref:EAL domain-containing protein n=1 Tax=Bacillus lumedeiriae TaxID=3058829 RepID=A0ABW8IBQ5_9BACI